MKRRIDEIKARKGMGRHSSFLAGDMLQHHTDFFKRNRRGETINPEFIRLMPVLIVSCCESFFKEIFAQYIDAGEPWLSKASGLHKANKPDVDFDTLKSISDKSFSIGDLYAYSLKYHSFSEIKDSYKIITGADYLDRISTMPNDSNDEDIEMAKKKIRDIFTSMKALFYTRHCVVHEYPAMGVSVSLDELLIYLDNAWLLLNATDILLYADLGKPRNFDQASFFGPE